MRQARVFPRGSYDPFSGLLVSDQSRLVLRVLWGEIYTVYDILYIGIVVKDVWV